MYRLIDTSLPLVIFSAELIIGWLLAYYTGFAFDLSIILVSALLMIIGVVFFDKFDFFDYLFPAFFLTLFFAFFSLFMSTTIYGDGYYHKLHLAAGDYRKTYRAVKGDENLVLTGPTKNKVHIAFHDKKWKARVKGSTIYLENGEQLMYHTENRPHPDKEGFGIKMELLIGVIEGDSIHQFSEEIFEYTDDRDIYPLEGIYTSRRQVLGMAQNADGRSYTAKPEKLCT